MIDNCCFVNRQCATNQEWDAGWHAFQRNECPASQPAAPAAPAPVSAAAGQPIDNCCYVDRQCQSEAEWSDGYHAYQNGQCAAPAQPQPAPPAQPVASAPAIVDNCCFVDRLCQSEAEWAAGYQAFQSGQCAAPARAVSSAPTRPLIQGSDRFVHHVNVVLDLMEREAPEWYNYAISGLSFIVEVPIPDQDMTHECTALAYKSQRKATLEACWINKFQLFGWSAKYDQLAAATAIVHEACHIHIGDAGLVYESEYEEKLCRERGGGVEIALDPHQRYWKYTVRETGEPVINLHRRWCAEGYYPELYCPTFQRLKGG